MCVYVCLSSGDLFIFSVRFFLFLFLFLSYSSSSSLHGTGVSCSALSLPPCSWLIDVFSLMIHSWIPVLGVVPYSFWSDGLTNEFYILLLSLYLGVDLIHPLYIHFYINLFLCILLLFWGTSFLLSIVLISFFLSV